MPQNRIEVPGNSKPAANGMNHANTSHMHGKGASCKKLLTNVTKLYRPNLKQTRKLIIQSAAFFFTIDLLDSITPAEENVPPSQDSMQVLSAPNRDSRKPAKDKQKDNEVTDFCGSCNAPYHANAFWIGCDGCDQWFHGKYVNITATEAKHLKDFMCADCIGEEIGE